jgi:hypothetical protein
LPPRARSSSVTYNDLLAIFARSTSRPLTPGQPGATGYVLPPAPRFGPRTVAIRLAEVANGDRLAAQDAAEAHANFLRVRSIKQQALEVAIFRVKDTSTPTNRLTREEILATALLQCASELRELDGYERKARSRRNRAFRGLWE